MTLTGSNGPHVAVQQHDLVDDACVVVQASGQAQVKHHVLQRILLLLQHVKIKVGSRGCRFKPQLGPLYSSSIQSGVSGIGYHDFNRQVFDALN